MQLLSYVIALGTTAIVYGIVIWNYDSLVAQLIVGFAYGLLFGMLVIMGCKLTLDDPTEPNTIKTNYYREILK